MNYTECIHFIYKIYFISNWSTYLEFAAAVSTVIMIVAKTGRHLKKRKPDGNHTCCEYRPLVGNKR